MISRLVAPSRPVIRRALAGAALIGLVGAVAACGDDAGAAGGDGKLAFTSYSTPAEAYKELLPAFQKTPAGAGVTFSESYGASGAQSRAVAAGLPTDVVALSLAPDVDKLVAKGIVAKDWADDEYKGFVTESVVVFVVRKGNPKNIKTWDDLIKPGVQVVTPNPFTSGGAKWNTMAAYGAKIQQGQTETQAADYLRAFYKNVVSQDKSARESLQTFGAGKGDVLISYENEALTAQEKGIDVDYVIPTETILIENPIAVTETSQNTAKAQALVDYLRSAPAQQIYVKHHYRPVLDSANDPAKFPTPTGLFTIDKFGGWPAVDEKIFAETGLMGEIAKSLGVSTG